jgi:hypothetical protein
MSKSDKKQDSVIESKVNDSTIVEDSVEQEQEPVSARTKEEDAHAAKLDKFHKEHNAVSFTDRVNLFKYYLLDREAYKKDRMGLVRRGIITVNSWNEWVDIINKNEKLLFNYKCVQGSELKRRYGHFYNSLVILATELKQKVN